MVHLAAKVNAGADFIITQLVYDAQTFLAFQRRARSVGIRVPILPGLMPIYVRLLAPRIRWDASVLVARCVRGGCEGRCLSNVACSIGVYVCVGTQ
jgi:hypothetical protein